jgi:hypothetical protein
LKKDGNRHTNVNLGQDTRANRTRHTSNSSTKPHAKHQHTNAHQTDLTLTHTPRDRRTMSINRRHRPPHTHTHSVIATRERERLGDHRLRELHLTPPKTPPTPPTPPPAPPPGDVIFQHIYMSNRSFDDFQPRSRHSHSAAKPWRVQNSALSVFNSVTA